MAVKTVKASYLVDKFKYMCDNHWRYEANASEEGAVDCSGAFYYWYKLAGSYMYHGSNTMWRDYTTEKGKIGEINLVPGMAVFKRRDWTEADSDNRYYNDKIGNFYHVGLYIGNNTVAEAKSTKRGCVYSKLSEWGYCAKLKYTTYDTVISESKPVTISNTDYQIGVVSTPGGGPLNMRTGPSTMKTIINTIPNGTQIEIIKQEDSWYYIKYNNKKGYCSSKYIVIASANQPKEATSNDVFYRKIIIETYEQLKYEELLEYLANRSIEYIVEGGDD